MWVASPGSDDKQGTSGESTAQQVRLLIRHFFVYISLCADEANQLAGVRPQLFVSCAQKHVRLADFVKCFLVHIDTCRDRMLYRAIPPYRVQLCYINTVVQMRRRVSYEYTTPTVAPGKPLRLEVRKSPSPSPSLSPTPTIIVINYHVLVPIRCAIDGEQYTISPCYHQGLVKRATSKPFLIPARTPISRGLDCSVCASDGVLISHGAPWHITRTSKTGINMNTTTFPLAARLPDLTSPCGVSYISRAQPSRCRGRE